MCFLVLRHYGPDILGALARTAQMTADSLSQPSARPWFPVWRQVDESSRLRKVRRVMAVEATWHVKLTRRDHSRTAFTDYLNRVPKRGAIITLHIDGERVKLRIDVVHEQPRGQRAASLGVFDVLATEVD